MYTNPVIFADYSDPDVIRVGDTYYMTASSFNWVPGLPLLVSKDLVSWNLVGYAAPTIPLPQYDKPLHSKGVWAPSIRYHNDRFVIVVGFPDEGIFVTESVTSDFAGEWTPLRCVRPACGFIDPCPIWDDDGKAYIVHAYAKSRIGFKSRIGVFEVDPVTLDAIGEDKFIFYGDETQPTIEGPKVCKRNGYYHIFAPAGGVKPGWQVDLRSKSIFGPYEEKILLRQGETHINGPHQGGLVDTPDGKMYFLHFQDRGIYGRVTLLEPAEWVDDWPLLGTSVVEGDSYGYVPGAPVDTYQEPAIVGSKDIGGISAVADSDDFANGIGLQWQWQGNTKDNFFEYKSGSLVLNAISGDSKIIWDLPQIITQKIARENFVTSWNFDASSLQDWDRCGVIFIGGQYGALCVERKNDSWQLSYVESKKDESDKDKRVDVVVDSFVLPENVDVSKFNFAIDFKANPVNKDDAAAGTCDSLRPASGTCTFKASYICNGKSESWSPKAAPYAPSGDHWVGGRVGMFCQSLSDAESKGFASFNKVETIGE